MASSCSLTVDGRSEQLARYAALAGSVVRVEREPASLRVAFAPGYDRALLGEALAVERACCPFLTISEGDGALSVSVADPDDAPVLDVLAEAFRGGR
ncbi:MAG: hypothetical protein M3340_19715 [Actinomycetota bacterium]|nr:hypothetical protein [Actinomycetota bacterium]